MKRPREAADEVTAAFLRGQATADRFDHVAHLRAAFFLLQIRPFPEALALFSRNLRRLARRAGRPGLYHETMTVAFFSLLAERVARQEPRDFATFLAANPDLTGRRCLERWYDAGTLASPEARRTFLLPRPAAHV